MKLPLSLARENLGTLVAKLLSQDQSGLDTKCEEIVWALYPPGVSKFHSKQAMKALSGSGFISTLSLTSALGGGGCSTPRPAALPAGRDPVPVVQEAGWAPGRVLTGTENLAPLCFDPRTVQPVVSRYTD